MLELTASKVRFVEGLIDEDGDQQGVRSREQRVRLEERLGDMAELVHVLWLLLDERSR